MFADGILSLTREQAEIVHRRIEGAIAEALRYSGSEHAAGTATPFIVMGALVPMPD